MANSKSALKRWRQSLAARDRNRSIKSRTRTALGKALAAIQDDASTAEEAVRNAVSLGGDADTMACIAGAVAEAHYGLPPDVERETLSRLDGRLREVVQEFRGRFC